MRQVERCGRVTGWRVDGSRLEVTHERGVTRVEAVAEDVVRIRFAPDGRFRPVRSWDVIAPVEPRGPALTARRAGGLLRIGLGACEGRLDLTTGALGWRRDGVTFADGIGGPSWGEVDLEELALQARAGDALPPGPARRGVRLAQRLPAGEGIYGWGQRLAGLDRRGRRWSNWTVDFNAPHHTRGLDNLYQAHPAFLALRPGLAWGLFLHSTWYHELDAGAAQADRLELFTLGGELDLFLLLGPTPAAVVEQLTRLTGRPLLPPLWALGFHQSRWSYPSSAEVATVAEEFRARGLGIDCVHLDIDYMRGYRVFTWDPERFSDPVVTLAHLHDRGIRAVTIVDPGVKAGPDAGYVVADEGLARGAFIPGPDGAPFTGYVWPGASWFPDFARADVRAWWGEHHPALLDMGVDGIWIDMNEPALADAPFPRGRETHLPLGAPQGDPGERTCHAELHNLYGHLMARATWEALRQHRPGRRPWVITRSAFTGTQRYAVSWMGDNRSRWEDLAVSLPEVASVGLCGMVHTGVDVGGFFEDGEAELFARWIELGAFYPFFRCHTAHGTRRQEPWSFGVEVEEVAREAIALRYRLLPYLYTLAHEATRTGAPLFRPLLYDFPDEPRLHAIEDQALLGPLVLVAPVLARGVRRRTVELPPGPWYDLHTGRRVEGRRVEREAPLGLIPAYVRGGALLTLGDVRPSTAEPLRELTVAVYPGPTSSAWTLVEDDGETEAWRDGAVAETTFAATPGEGELEVRCEARAGAYAPPPRTLAVRVHLPAPPQAVTLDGAPAEWRWEEAQAAALVRWEDDGAAHRVHLTTATP